ncbi:hypothetical protein BYT27DRAFT_7102548, partial [Phlegmacium glaucopus]
KVNHRLHIMLDKYAFFAMTGSLTTLNQLITLVQGENAVLQNKFDNGVMYMQQLAMSLTQPPISDAQYKLVALHPEHLLPARNVLTVYDYTNDQVSQKPT